MKYLPTQTKTFTGKRYSLVGVDDTKREAGMRVKRAREAGAKARVVRISKAPKGEAGYTRTRWAVYARY